MPLGVWKSLVEQKTLQVLIGTARRVAFLLQVLLQSEDVRPQPGDDDLGSARVTSLTLLTPANKPFWPAYWDLNGPCWVRTNDLGIKSPLLYRLS